MTTFFDQGNVDRDAVRVEISLSALDAITEAISKHVPHAHDVFRTVVAKGMRFIPQPATANGGFIVPPSPPVPQTFYGLPVKETP